MKLERLNVDIYEPDGMIKLYYPDGDLAAIVHGNLGLGIDALDIARQIIDKVEIAEDEAQDIVR